jgi:type IV secretory pathway VirB10-like protein
LLVVAALATVGSCPTAHAGGLPGGDPLQRLRAEESASQHPARRAGIIWVALGSGATLLVVLSAVQTRRPLRLARGGAQTPEGGAHMRRRLNEREEIGAEQVEAGEQGFAELGQHVGAVLATAREAAERILGEAREKAAQIEVETAEKRSAAFAAAEDVRTRADAYAERKRQEADEAATQVIARAEGQARDVARAAEERQQELEANVERTEERLRKLVANMREVADRLEAFVGPDALDEALQRQVEAEVAPATQEA